MSVPSRFCPSCGAPSTTSANFCQSCGKAFNGKPSGGAGGILIALGIVAVLAVAVLVGVAAFRFLGNKNQPVAAQAQPLREKLIGSWINDSKSRSVDGSVWDFRPDGSLAVNLPGGVGTMSYRWSVEGTTVCIVSPTSKELCSDIKMAPDGWSFIMDGDEFRHFGTKPVSGR